MRATLCLLALTGFGIAPAHAASDARQTFEDKCLVCHSSSLIERRRLRPAAWREVVHKMRARAPLLIGREDVPVIVRYLVRELKLTPPRAPTAARVERPAAPVAPVGAGPPVAAAEPEEAEEEGEPEAPGAGPPAGAAPGRATGAAAGPIPVPPALAHATEELDTEAEAQGPTLLKERCSKCHTLFRVFTKIDSLAAGDSVIERMRRKTGSGISPRDADMLRRFLRSRAAQ
ncbi:MAG TPA: hypothetical protein VKN99_02315 [Polyangia bacterium]|nr:hypothetical protein [Polyangia bacterium]